MKNKCERAIMQYNMLSQGDTVVVGVSGGADSMALLHYLHTNRSRYGIRVIAAHFNHGIRGDEADTDECFVRDYCEQNNICFAVEKADIPALAVQRKEGIEECARKMRYSFLDSVADDAKIATAHTNSDSCESFLFHFARGTGLSGLCGIPPVRANIIRPLIFCSAEDTRRYCRENGIVWREDSTNSDTKYTRNYIRKNIVTLLKQVNSSFEENALRCMQILQTENDYILEQSERVLSLCRMDEYSLDMSVLNKQHNAIIKRVLLSFVRACGCCDVSMEQIERLLAASDREVLTLNNGIRFQKKDSVLLCMHETVSPEDICIPVELIDNCSLRFFDWNLRFSYAEHIDHEQSQCAYFDADKVFLPVLRNRRQGDCIRIKKRNCTKTLKQLFSEAKISEAYRRKWPILADEKGVIWIAQFGVDKSRLPDENSKNIIKIEWGKSL